MTAAGAPRISRASNLAIVACALAYALPALVQPIVALGDFPGHMARYHLQLYLADTPGLQRWYALDWRLLGNLGGDLVMQVLGRLAGVEAGARILAAAIPALTAAGLLLICRQVHGRMTAAAILATPLAYAYPYHFGFINFSLATGLGLLAFAGWLALGERRGRRAMLFSLITPALWVCHIHGWVLFAILAGAALLVERPFAPRRLVAEGWPLAVPLLLMAAQLATSSAGGVTLAADWFDLPSKLVFLLSPLRDRWLAWDVGFALLLLSIVGVALIRPRTSCDPGLLLAAAILWLLFLLSPRLLLGSVLADMRIVPLALTVSLLACRPADAKQERWQVPAAILLVAARLAGTAWSLSIGGAALQRELAALPHIPRGASLVSLVGRTGDGGWALPRLGHVPAFALIRRDAFASNLFLVPGQQPLTLVSAPVPAIARDPQHYAPDPATLAAKLDLVAGVRARCPACVDALWIVGAPGPLPPPPPGMVQRWRQGRSAVFVADPLRPLPPEPRVR